MGLRAKASAFGHPKSPHAAAVEQRPFTAALQLLLPRSSNNPTTSTSISMSKSSASSHDGAAAFTDVSGALGGQHRRREKGRRSSGGGGSGNGSGSPATSPPDFYAARLTFPQLLDEGFLATHVRAPGAALHALCVDGRLDREDVAAVTPSGHMHLSLTPRTYTRMGVTGAKTHKGAGPCTSCFFSA